MVRALGGNNDASVEDGWCFTPEQANRMLPLVVSELEGTEIELAVFEPVHLRQAPPSPVDGRPQKRAPISEVECLLAASA